MNEGERCDRIALMHAGKVLASDTPRQLQQARRATSLEEAFIDVPTRGRRREMVPLPLHRRYLPRKRSGVAANFSCGASAELPGAKAWSYCAIRYAWSLPCWAALLMLIMGYGLTLDVEDLRFAVLDYDHSPQSRDYVQSLSGSRYFLEEPPLRDAEDMEQRMRSGEIALALEIPPGFGRDLKRGHVPEVGVWADGSMPFRGETAGGYVQGMHYQYLPGFESTQPQSGSANRCRRSGGALPLQPGIPEPLRDGARCHTAPAGVHSGDPDGACSSPREGAGSIINLYVTPVTRLISRRQTIAVYRCQHGQFSRTHHAIDLVVPSAREGTSGCWHSERS